MRPWRFSEAWISCGTTEMFSVPTAQAWYEARFRRSWDENETTPSDSDPAILEAIAVSETDAGIGVLFSSLRNSLSGSIWRRCALVPSAVHDADHSVTPACGVSIVMRFFTRRS